MKIGVIGLGDIARKAYLPVITTRSVDIHLCSRDEKKLSAIGDQYRISNRHRDLDSLINAGVEAAFVHTATSSHEEIIGRLLENNIHVYVDKPVTDSYKSTERLVSLAKSKSLILKAGFNRRYAPAYAQLKNVEGPNMIIMQKNRTALPGETRTFIFDDFIHVIDTLLFLMNGTPEKIDVKSRSTSGKLNHVVVTFMNANGTTAIGIMNRDSAITEERMEVFSSNEKRIVVNLTEAFTGKDKSESKLVTDPWQPMLKQRGFEDIIDDFINGVRLEVFPSPDEILATHKFCETIVQLITNNQ